MSGVTRGGDDEIFEINAPYYFYPCLLRSHLGIDILNLKLVLFTWGHLPKSWVTTRLPV